ncbi:MAG: NTP transferase domain-containing protein [Fulvivirga sp.]
MSKLYGLVLCGGSSTRMGQDKSLLNYHGVPQREHIFQLLSKHVDQCFYSVKQGTTSDQRIVDNFDIQSPLNGILSAFELHNDVAWLVVACDMPLIDDQHIANLMLSRDRDKLATCFAGTDQKPHPLFTIYEPNAREKLIAHSKMSKSPRAFLMNESVKIIDEQHKDFLTSIDSIAQFQALKNRL